MAHSELDCDLSQFVSRFVMLPTHCAETADTLCRKFSASEVTTLWRYTNLLIITLPAAESAQFLEHSRRGRTALAGLRRAQMIMASLHKTSKLKRNLVYNRKKSTALTKIFEQSAGKNKYINVDELKKTLKEYPKVSVFSALDQRTTLLFECNHKLIAV